MMLNLVELDSVREGEQMERLEYLAHSAMKAVGIDNYELVKESSGVYIETLDIVADGVEMASGAYGPHPLDADLGDIPAVGRYRSRTRESRHGKRRIPDHKSGQAKVLHMSTAYRSNFKIGNFSSI